MSTPIPSRPYHHGDLREALLRQAERVLGERGVEGLSLRELARDVGVSHGAPRRHFADRQALLDALALEGYARLGARLDAALAGRGGHDGDDDITGRLTAFAHAYVGFALEHRALLGLMHAAKNEGAAPGLVAANDRAFAAPVRLLAEARERGLIDGDTTGRVDMTVLAVLQGLAVMAATGMAGARSTDILVSETVETLLRGLRPR